MRRGRAPLRSQLGRLIVAGLLIFVPLGLLDASLDLLPEVEGEVDTFEVIEAIVGASASVLFSLLGEVFFVAIVSAYVVAESEGRTVRLGAILRRLPLGRLLAADLAYAMLVFVGLILLIVPGLIFLTWYTLVAPAIELEHRRFRDGFRRSRELVRHRFWLVFAITVPLAFSSEAALVARVQRQCLRLRPLVRRRVGRIGPRGDADRADLRPLRRRPLPAAARRSRREELTS